MPIHFQVMNSCLERLKKPFDLEGNITNEGTINFLEQCLDNFIQYVGVVSKLKKPKPIEPEDLDCNNPIATTVTEVDLMILNG